MAANLVLERSVSYWLKKQKVPHALWNLLELHFDPNKVVIDLGCAGGRLCKAIAPYFQKTFALDKNKNLIKAAAEEGDKIDFVCGDFGIEKTWKKLNTKFDLIVSDCAIRKDYIEISKLADLCFRYLKPKGSVVFRMQAIQDMSNIFPAHIRRSLFYNEKEIESAFSQFDLKINLEFFVQKFSTNKYLSEYLKLINIQDEPEASLLNLSRQYFIMEAIKK